MTRKLLAGALCLSGAAFVVVGVLLIFSRVFGPVRLWTSAQTYYVFVPNAGLPAPMAAGGLVIVGVVIALVSLRVWKSS